MNLMRNQIPRQSMLSLNWHYTEIKKFCHVTPFFLWYVCIFNFPHHQCIGEDVSTVDEINENEVTFINENVYLEDKLFNNPVECRSEANKETAFEFTDDELVLLLTKPPKTVPFLKTKSGFQEFFKGTTKKRMYKLLALAYSDLKDLDKQQKINKRLELLNNVLI